MTQEQLFVKGENELFSSKTSLQIETVSPMDEHWVHIKGHARYLYKIRTIKHIVKHFLFLFKKKNTKDIGDYLMKKYS